MSEEDQGSVPATQPLEAKKLVEKAIARGIHGDLQDALKISQEATEISSDDITV